ncbi:rhodanese-like domain-containing protein 4A, chloroplastic [Phoenix dactylifera]|uniref:Rhodanese-like domain-containing protein 4A, chloroplastic n=1 Tax=Phoenix dactylifera TaxID=42345 RepID=A0A8B7BYX4_PHODC|nr:rhodanese-like domain-containing protein 4A, chloroplastic [Phoenix dactylifera]
MIPLQDHRLIPKPSPFLQISASHPPNPHQKCFPTKKIPAFFKFPTSHFPNSLAIQVSAQKTAPFLKILASNLQIPLEDSVFTNNLLKPHHFLALMAAISFPFPSSAAETELSASDKINIEAILISIDDFLNQNPFFVAGVTFIWLVVIPLTQEYLKKYKYISAIDAFRKLRDVPNSQLLDIRSKKSVQFMSSPNLNIFDKDAVQVEFAEGEEEGFVKEVMKNFKDPANTIICVLDSFDGVSLEVAELLFKNGFKEAYAIKGGLRGKDGWQAIQETLLPPSVHVHPKKRSKTTNPSEVNNQRTDDQNNGNGQALASSSIHHNRNQNTGYDCIDSVETAPEAKLATERPLSPYPNYPDLKPPSSPTPSKP